MGSDAELSGAFSFRFRGVPILIMGCPTPSEGEESHNRVDIRLFFSLRGVCETLVLRDPEGVEEAACHA